MQKMLFHFPIPQATVIYHPFHPWKIFCYLMVSKGISIASAFVTLWSYQIPIMAPRCQKNCILFAILMEWDGMITIPCVATSFDCVAWNGHCLMIWRFCGMCLSLCCLTPLQKLANSHILSLEEDIIHKFSLGIPRMFVQYTLVQH